MDLEELTTLNPDGMCPECTQDGGIRAGLCRGCNQIVEIWAVPSILDVRLTVRVHKGRARGVG